MRVLLAGDNGVNRKFVAKLLQKHGHTVVISKNGREPIETIEGQSIDLLLMSVQIPGKDGMEAIRTIRTKELQTGAHMPIIALTAPAMKEARERCLEAGADDCLTEPIRAGDFQETLERVRRRRSGVTKKGILPSKTSSLAVLDVAAAIVRFEGDWELLEKLARLFAEECPKNMSEIRRAWNAEDFVLLERLAHTLNGSSANLGAEGIHQAALALETQARSGGFEKALERIKVLQAEMDRLLPELDVVFGKFTY